MSAVRGHLNDTLRFSSVDGPGNRFVVFLQGCNFNCTYCHNPYTIGTCTHCGLCIDPCSERALSWVNGRGVVVDRTACTDQGTCMTVCDYDSTPLSSMVTVEDLLGEIRETAPFLSGITVSGGEPTLQPEFVAALFEAIKADAELAHLTTFVDSNGAATRQTWDIVLPNMDAAMIDLKAFDDASHRSITGVPNNRVLETIPFLAAKGRLFEVRLVVVPGENDSTEELTATAAWLADIDPAMRIKLIGVRRHGVREMYLDRITEPDPAAMERYEGTLRDGGLTEIVVV